MPVTFLTTAQREGYGRYAAAPTSEELARFFHLTDDDRSLIAKCRGEHNRLGFALQLTTARYIGTFQEDPAAVPRVVLQALGRQLGITNPDCIQDYRESEQRWIHAEEIRSHYDYRDFSDPSVGFRLNRWLYALCWTGTESANALFTRATSWLLVHKVLLPGCSVLERFVSRLRKRVETRLWRLLVRGITAEQQMRMEALLVVPEGSRGSFLDQLRLGPFRVSGPALIRAIKRIQTVRDLGITLPAAAHIPQSRLASLARYANKAKVTAITKLTPARRLATLVAFVHCLEATAQDDALDVLGRLLQDLFNKAKRADKKARLRTLKDLDRAAATLAEACQAFLDQALPDDKLRAQVFSKIPRDHLAKALEEVGSLIRPPDDVYYKELNARWLSVRRYLPALVHHLRFGANPAGEPLVAAFDWLRENVTRSKPPSDAPRDVISKPWQRHVVRDDGGIDHHAYVFCVLDELSTALKRRDVFVSPSWRYADPRACLLRGQEWESTRPIICRTLKLSARPEPMLSALTEELDQTYQAVAAHLPENHAVRFEVVDGRNELIVSPLDKLEEPSSLVALRDAVSNRLPRLDLPEVMLEVVARTKFNDDFRHVSEAKARATDLSTSLCAVLLAQACNTGLKPLIHNRIPALRRDRLSWVRQNYLRAETLTNANARLVAAQNNIPLAHAWGGGEVASADGLRFVVPVRTVHAGSNPKYFGVRRRGMTSYSLVSDQYTSLNTIAVPGTLRDSLILLSVVLEQQTELQPKQIITDTGAYSDVVFGLFRLLGYRFSPRLSDIGGARFWRIDRHADYGALNDLARQRVNLKLIAQNWDDLLRLAGSLKLGRVPATGIMRTLQVGDRPTRLAKAVAEFGRIDKTLHMLTYIDDEKRRRDTLVQLNRGEGRNGLSRVVFHGRRGELRQRYREGQEDQLGALGLVVNIIVLWNTIYMDAALTQLRCEGYPVRDEDVARLSPLTHGHINMLGRYSFALPESVLRGQLRPLRDPDDDD